MALTWLSICDISYISCSTLHSYTVFYSKYPSSYHANVLSRSEAFADPNGKVGWWYPAWAQRLKRPFESFSVLGDFRISTFFWLSMNEYLKRFLPLRFRLSFSASTLNESSDAWISIEPFQSQVFVKTKQRFCSIYWCHNSPGRGTLWIYLYFHHSPLHKSTAPQSPTWPVEHNWYRLSRTLSFLFPNFACSSNTRAKAALENESMGKKGSGPFGGHQTGQNSF